MKNSLIKQEFFLWLVKLQQEDLTEDDRKILNLLLDNIDDIIPYSAARGARARRVSALIEKNCTTLSSTLPSLNDINTVDFIKPKTISELVVGPFRGFSTKETFVFDKKYTFMYGPNGSGKTSFCEGIEYALLGRIEEAESRRIDIKEYIKNISTKKSEKPVIIGMDEKSHVFEIPQNPHAYRFCFIERSRIDGFARLAANPPKAQQDRISTLFGLDNFNDFVSGFSDTLDEKYLMLVNPKRIEYNHFTSKIEAEEKNKDKICNSLRDNSIEIEEFVKGVCIENTNSLEDLRSYLVGEDGTKGRINELHEFKAKQVPENIDGNILSKHKESLKSLKDLIELISKKSIELKKFSSELDFKELYSVLTNISKNPGIDRSTCPACKTPIENVIVNPFVNASNELVKMKELGELQSDIDKLKLDIQKGFRAANKEISILNKYKQILEDNSNFFNLYDESSISGIHNLDEWINYFCKNHEILENDVNDNNELESKIEIFNNELKQKRDEKSIIDEEIKSCNIYKEECDRLSTLRNSLTEQKSKIEKTISDFDTDNKKLLIELEELDKKCEIHSKLAISYEKIIRNLKKHMSMLPSEMSAGLSEKAKEFYNIINSHDQEFERLEGLSIPTNPGENITIRFIGDNREYNALLILSEGHIRILGLSILLAKIVKEDLNFIIYDDIVNAIDDDHKDGISNLIINNADMAKRQHIITCHGDVFIIKLENKLGASEVSKNVCRYRFNPSDGYNERGIRVSGGTTKHHIETAQNLYLENACKDAASKCRQALENITEQLWRNLSSKLNVSLTVSMRTPGSRPDLASVVVALIKDLKKIKNTEKLVADFILIREDYNWRILNKGIHEQGDLPEFDRADIKRCIEVIERIENGVNELKKQMVISNEREVEITI